MSGFARREQLVAVGRSLFAEKGFGATSVEEIAARAKVSKPVVYEHFGGKEGLYAVVVDREVQALISSLQSSLESSERPRLILENATLGLLDYIERKHGRLPRARARRPLGPHGGFFFLRDG